MFMGMRKNCTTSLKVKQTQCAQINNMYNTAEFVLWIFGLGMQIVGDFFNH